MQRGLIQRGLARRKRRIVYHKSSAQLQPHAAFLPARDHNVVVLRQQLDALQRPLSVAVGGQINVEYCRNLTYAAPVTAGVN